MDVLSKLLMSVDSFRHQLSSSAKKYADDYYAVVGALNDETLKMNDGSMLSFFELRGFSKILTESEKKSVCEKIERSLDGFLPKSGYSIQIVDFADPEMTREFARQSMQPSFDEMKAMGIDHPLLTEDYLDFVAGRTVWKKQYLIAQTHPSSVKSEFLFKGKKSEEETLKSSLASDVVEKMIKENANGQAIFSSEKEKLVAASHIAFSDAVMREFCTHGVMLIPMEVEPALIAQKQCMYGSAYSPEWRPVIGKMFMSKASESADKPGQIKLDTAPLVEQVVDVGGTEEDMPPEMFSFGERIFTTLSMVVPQVYAEQMKSYSYLSSRIRKDIGHIVSFRMDSDPFSTSKYAVDLVYAGLTSMFPGSGNAAIRNSRYALAKLHKENQSTCVYLEMTVTLFAKDIETLQKNRREVKTILDGWNSAQFRSVEMDKMQGMMDSMPGVSRSSNLKQVMESFSMSLYQSPMFTSGMLYDRGYLHFFTEDGQPFPFEEHSSLNINYNVFISGQPGSGKSTLLTMLNLALLVKPKVDPRLSGEFPLMMDVDFGKTSFGFKETIRNLVDKSKKSLFLLHEMTTDIDSAINFHDLPFGRTSPTMRHKEALVRFMEVLFSGVEKVGKSDFKLIYPEIGPMISYMIDSVYAERHPDANPRRFHEQEFKHQSTLKYLDGIGVKPNRNYSYYGLADEVMKRDPSSKGVRHAILLRRYAFPRMDDYGRLLSDSPELSGRFKKGKIGSKTELDFFVSRLAEISSEFPCFSGVTKVNIDFARMISIDILNICGESDHRKAIFGSLCMMAFLVKRENDEQSADLYKGVQEQYLPYLKRLSTMNKVLPGTLNIEEAHMLYKLFNDIMTSNQRHNRKAGWGMRSLSQNLADPEVDFFSMCSMVVVTSNENGDDVDGRLKAMGTSLAERQVVGHEMVNRNAFFYIRTREGGALGVTRVGIKLNMGISGGLLWISNSEQVDRNFKNEVMDRLGKDGLLRLSRFYRKGTVRSYYNSVKISDLAKRKGFDSVFDMLIHEVTTQESPSEELAALL